MATFSLAEVVSVASPLASPSEAWTVAHLRGGPAYRFSGEDAARFLDAFERFRALGQ